MMTESAKSRTEMLMWAVGLLVSMGIVAGGFAVSGFQSQLRDIRDDFKTFAYPIVDGRVLEIRVNNWADTQADISEKQGQVIEKLNVMQRQIEGLTRDIQELNGRAAQD
jgi:hypothetical protein